MMLQQNQIYHSIFLTITVVMNIVSEYKSKKSVTAPKGKRMVIPPVSDRF